MFKYLLASLLLLVSFIMPVTVAAAIDWEEQAFMDAQQSYQAYQRWATLKVTPVTPVAVSITQHERDDFYRIIMAMSGPAVGSLAMPHAVDVWNRYCQFMGWEGGRTFEECLNNWKLRQIETDKPVVIEIFERDG